MDKKHCAGCRQNFYNGNNDMGIKECWMLKTAKVVTRYEIHMDAPMNVRSNYRKVRRPTCFDTGGYSGTGTALLDKIPHYAK